MSGARTHLLVDEACQQRANLTQQRLRRCGTTVGRGATRGDTAVEARRHQERRYERGAGVLVNKVGGALFGAADDGQQACKVRVADGHLFLDFIAKLRRKGGVQQRGRMAAIMPHWTGLDDELDWTGQSSGMATPEGRCRVRLTAILSFGKCPSTRPSSSSS